MKLQIEPNMITLKWHHPQ